MGQPPLKVSDLLKENERLRAELNSRKGASDYLAVKYERDAALAALREVEREMRESGWVTSADVLANKINALAPPARDIAAAEFSGHPDEWVPNPPADAPLGKPLVGDVNGVPTSDAGKLLLLADWFDAKYPNDPDEVQRDLRRMADLLAKLHAAIAREDG